MELDELTDEEFDIAVNDPNRVTITEQKRRPLREARANRDMTVTREDLIAQIEIMQWKLLECRRLREKITMALAAHDDRA